MGSFGDWLVVCLVAVTDENGSVSHFSPNRVRQGARLLVAGSILIRLYHGGGLDSEIGFCKLLSGQEIELSRRCQTREDVRISVESRDPACFTVYAAFP